MNRILVLASAAVALAACSRQSATQPSQTEVTAAQVSPAAHAMRGVIRVQAGRVIFEDCNNNVPGYPVAQSGPQYQFIDDYYRSGILDPRQGAVTNVIAHRENRNGEWQLVIDRVDKLVSGANVSCSTRY